MGMKNEEIYFEDYPIGTIAGNGRSAFFRVDDGWAGTEIGTKFEWVRAAVLHIPQHQVKVGDIYTRNNLQKLDVPYGTVVVKNSNDGGVAWQYLPYGTGWVSAGNEIEDFDHVNPGIEFKVVFVGDYTMNGA